MSESLVLDALSAFSALCSAIAAVISVVVSVKNNKNSEKLAQQANEMAEKQARTEREMELRRNITAAFHREHSASWDLQQAAITFMEKKGSDLPTSQREAVLKKDPDYKLRQSILNAAREDLRNAYEEACDLYLHEDLDQFRFRQEYEQDIKRLVESRQNKYYYFPYSVEYQATSKVYQSWFPGSR